MSLTIKCSDIAQTRATEAGEDAYNENKIDRLDVFFYAAGATGDADAIYRMTLTSLNATGSYTYDQRIETTIIETIFGTGANAVTQAKIYAIANLPAGITVSDNASVNELKATAIETAALAGTVMQDNFVMDSTGDDIATYDSGTRGITGEIKLYRAASKIALFITEVNSVPVTDADGNVQKDAKGNDIMWTANTNGMMVRLNNGVKKTHLDNIVSPYNVDQEADYFSFASGKERKMVADGSQWKQELPFYSYSSDWSADGKDKEAFLTLIVPWQKSDAPGVYHNTYYQVPINGISEDLVRNNYYKISLKVSRLGTFTEGDAVTITPGTYIILDWTTNTIDADMLDYRYLVVDQKEYTIYNQEELYIPFASSHETEIVDISFAQQNINVESKDPSWPTINSNSSNYLDALEIRGNQVYFKNELDNVYTSNTFDFTPYKVTFTLCHKGEYGDTYYENITITQYPAIFGGFRQNSDGSDNGNHGYMFVNGYYSTANSNSTDYANGLGSQDWFCSAPGLVNSGASPNMYVFNITSVYGTDYVIGDPRTVEIDNSLVNAKRTYRSASNTATAWVQAPALYDNTSNRGLRYYYPTDVDYTSETTMENSRTRNMIAPQFRIASAYGVLHPGNNNASASLEGMRKRCASYQEDGYPAGRWRLPTEAEFIFIIKQVNRDPATLPQLYISGSSYWCAHGLGKVNGTNVTMSYQTTSDGNSTRCVYDTWYWGDDRLSDPNVFTWGDMPR